MSSYASRARPCFCGPAHGRNDRDRGRDVGPAGIWQLHWSDAAGRRLIPLADRCGRVVVLNDALLTNFYGRLPDLFPDADFNWQGKALALLATLAIAALPALGWRTVGLTLRQAPGSLKTGLAVALLYVAFFMGLALITSNGPASVERIAFQLTLPGFEEEPFYRGVLLLMLCRAFAAQKRLLGVDCSWGAILSCVLLGMAYAFGFSEGTFHFDPLTMALTALPSLIAV